MIQDYLKAGYPALCVLTQEPHRAEQLLRSDGWSYYHWDCLQGIREAGSTKIVEEIKYLIKSLQLSVDAASKRSSLLSPI